MGGTTASNEFRHNQLAFWVVTKDGNFGVFLGYRIPQPSQWKEFYSRSTRACC